MSSCHHVIMSSCHHINPFCRISKFRILCAELLADLFFVDDKHCARILEAFFACSFVADPNLSNAQRVEGTARFSRDAFIDSLMPSLNGKMNPTMFNASLGFMKINRDKKMQVAYVVNLVRTAQMKAESNQILEFIYYSYVI